MKEKELIALGFNRKDVTAEESGCKDAEIYPTTDWYYYKMDFGNGRLGLISPASDEVQNDEWYIEIFDDNTIQFTDNSEVIALIDLLNRNTIKN